MWLPTKIIFPNNTRIDILYSKSISFIIPITVKILFGIVTIFTALSFLLRPAQASTSPISITPINSTVVSQVKLEWGVPLYTLATTNPYQVQIDNSVLFDSVDKDYLTKNNFYSPTSLAEGIWYWRVRAKDSTALWSDWSPAANFIYSTISPSPSPTITPPPLPTIEPEVQPSLTPSPTVSPTSTPTPLMTSSPIPSPSPSNIYSLGSIPTSINSNQSFQVKVSLQLPQQPNTIFYLKGAFFAEGSSNYFGQTKYSGNWIKNSGTYSSQYKIQTDSSGIWQGYLEIMPDSDDSGFPDSDDYLFKLARYTATGSGPTWTESQNIYITKLVSPSPLPTPSVYPSPSPIISFSPLPESYFEPETLLETTDSATLTETEASASALDIDPQIASIEGVATVAGEIQTKTPTLSNPDKLNPWWLYGASGLLFLTSTIYTLIVKYKPKLHFLYENYFSLFRKN